jgi:hypothetical protein
MDPMKNVLAVTAVGEGMTGVALLVVPSLFGQWLFGGELAGVGVTMARVTGIALIGLGIACWPGPARLGMLVYSAGAMLYLAWVGLTGGSRGVLLWPAVIVHAILTALLVRATVRGMRAQVSVPRHTGPRP